MATSNQLIIDLGDVTLTPKQMASLQKAIHKSVSKKLQAAAMANAAAPVVAAAAPAAAATALTVDVAVDFTGADPGLSEITATCNGVSQTANESGSKLRFNNVNVGNTIRISGSGAAGKIVSIIGATASPMQMNFAEGQHVNGIFLITG